MARKSKFRNEKGGPFEVKDLKDGALCLVALLACPFIASAKDELYTNHIKFDLHIERVRSVGPETRVGFGKSLPLYAVDASSTTTQYVLYCVRAAPKEGATYSAQEDYVSSNYSALRLWPAEKRSLGIKGSGRLYRVIGMDNVLPGDSHPDVACDVYSEREISH
jgi:hypothetical protein